MKRLKKGFTIAEMLICFTVIGVLASILIPSVIYNKPDKNKALVRKAYQITERVVSEMIADEDIFPAESGGARNLAYFDLSAEGDNARTRANTGKFFCKTFAEKLNVNGTVNCTTAASYGSDPSFVTNDGIHWYITPSIMCDHDVDPTNCPLPNESNGVPNCPTDISAALPYMCIYFDVNGDEGPNEEIPVSLTYEGADLSSSDVERADRGKFYVYWNGKVAVPKGQLERYLNSTSVFRER